VDVGVGVGVGVSVSVGVGVGVWVCAQTSLGLWAGGGSHDTTEVSKGMGVAERVGAVGTAGQVIVQGLGVDPGVGPVTTYDSQHMRLSATAWSL
jgi:hypothetical protein